MKSVHLLNLIFHVVIAGKRGELNVRIIGSRLGCGSMSNLVEKRVTKIADRQTDRL